MTQQTSGSFLPSRSVYALEAKVSDFKEKDIFQILKDKKHGGSFFEVDQQEAESLDHLAVMPRPRPLLGRIYFLNRQMNHEEINEIGRKENIHHHYFFRDAAEFAVKIVKGEESFKRSSKGVFIYLKETYQTVPYFLKIFWKADDTIKVIVEALNDKDHVGTGFGVVFLAEPKAVSGH